MSHWLNLVTKLTSSTSYARRACKFSKLNEEIRFTEREKLIILANGAIKLFNPTAVWPEISHKKADFHSLSCLLPGAIPKSI